MLVNNAQKKQAKVNLPAFLEKYRNMWKKLNKNSEDYFLMVFIIFFILNVVS